MLVAVADAGVSADLVIKLQPHHAQIHQLAEPIGVKLPAGLIARADRHKLFFHVAHYKSAKLAAIVQGRQGAPLLFQSALAVVASHASPVAQRIPQIAMKG